MAQILNDPAEFGIVVLEGKIRDHCLQRSDLEGCTMTEFQIHLTEPQVEVLERVADRRTHKQTFQKCRIQLI